MRTNVVIDDKLMHDTLRATGLRTTVITTRCIEAAIGYPHNYRDFDPFTKHLGLRVLIQAPR